MKIQTLQTLQTLENPISEIQKLPQLETNNDKKSRRFWVKKKG
jgi:hypothetical protein